MVAGHIIASEQPWVIDGQHFVRGALAFEGTDDAVPTGEGNEDYIYGARCQPHYFVSHQDCFSDGKPAATRPEWCDLPWCWVNKNTCNVEFVDGLLEFSNIATDQGVEVAMSFATCAKQAADDAEAMRNAVTLNYTEAIPEFSQYLYAQLVSERNLSSESGEDQDRVKREEVVAAVDMRASNFDPLPRVQKITFVDLDPRKNAVRGGVYFEEPADFRVTGFRAWVSEDPHGRFRKEGPQVVERGKGFVEYPFIDHSPSGYYRGRGAIIVLTDFR